MRHVILAAVMTGAASAQERVGVRWVISPMLQMPKIANSPILIWAPKIR